MRCALILATLLVVPTLGRAQATVPAGTMTFTITDADPAPSYINRAECSAAPGTNTVQINWTTTGSSSTGMQFQLFASNKVITPNATTGCPNSPPDATTSMTSVGGITNQSSVSVNNAPFDPTVIASALNINGNVACNLTVDTPIYLCVNALSGSTVTGYALGQMTLSTTLPDVAPTMSSVGTGNTALTPSWSTNGSANTQRYRVQAVSMANPGATPSPTWFDPNGGYAGFDPLDPNRHYSGYVSANEVRLGGLQNGVTYAVAVTGYTVAYNASTLDAAGIGTGTPAVSYDLWQVYKADGGQETGGCSSGVAGPLGLGLLAGALALMRRRK